MTATEAAHAVGTIFLVLAFVIPLTIAGIIILVAILRHTKKARIKRAARVQQKAAEAAHAAAERAKRDVLSRAGISETSIQLSADTTKFREGALGKFDK